MRWLGRWGSPRLELRRPMVTQLAVAWIIGSILASAVPTGAQGKFVTEYQLDRDLVEVPFEYHQHQIMIKVQSSGRKDLTFLWDSGANSPVVDKQLALRGTHLADTAIQEAEGVTAAEMIWLDDLRVGPENSAAKAYNLPALVADLSQLTRLLGRPIDGIVGISFMAHFVVEIDYDRHLLRFHRSQDYTIERRKPDNERTFLFDLSPSNPHRGTSTMVLHGLLHPKYDYDFLLDTGFGGYVGIAHLAAEEAGMMHNDTPRVSSTAYSVTHTFPSDKIRAPFLMLGDIDLAGKVVSIDYRNKDVIGQFGLVGNRLLQNYHVTLDYPHKKLLLERVTTTEEPDEAMRPAFGIVIRSDGKTLRVEHVKHDSPAQQAGVHNGDMLLALNGQRCGAMSTAEIANVLTSAQAGTQFLFRRGIDPNLGTGGEEYTVSLTPTSPFDWKPDEP